MSRSKKQPDLSTYGLVGMFRVAGPSSAHPGYIEVKLDDRHSARHATAVILVLEKFVLESGLREGDQLDLWVEQDGEQSVARQLDMFGSSKE